MFTMPSSFRLVSNVISEKIDPKSRSFEAIIELIVKVYEKIVEAMKRDPIAMGIGQPGYVNSDGDIGALANFDWKGMQPLRRLLLQRLKCQHIVVLDDANAALIAETQYYKHASTICMVTIGTGVGTSVCFKNGEIFSGRRGLIEGGHTIVELNGRLCPCGQKGCLEMYCSGTSICREATKRRGQVEDEETEQYILLNTIHSLHCIFVLKLLSNLQVEPYTAEQVVEDARNGDSIASAVLLEASRYLALGCVNITRMYDPDGERYLHSSHEFKARFYLNFLLLVQL